MKYTNITYNENGIEFIRTVRPTEAMIDVLHELNPHPIIKVNYYVVA